MGGVNPTLKSVNLLTASANRNSMKTKDSIKKSVPNRRQCWRELEREGNEKRLNEGMFVTEGGFTSDISDSLSPSFVSLHDYISLCPAGLFAIDILHLKLGSRVT